MSTKSWNIGPGWRLLLTDAGLAPVDVLRRAGLPDDTFSREGLLNTDEYFRLWQAMEQQSQDTTIGLRIGSKVSVEAFDPPLFAALCSRDLNEAFSRLARFKRLIAPATLQVDIGPESTAVEISWRDTTVEPPASIIDAELAFFVQLGRIGTRTRICPIEVQSPRLLVSAGAYRELFGLTPEKGPRPRVVFRAQDAATPFLTANPRMWDVFVPELQRRLSELDETATIADRVRAALLETLPGGPVSIETVSKRLAASPRTLQRRLRDEGFSFQDVLSRTREDLARHYLKTSRMSGAEISFLLGFEDPNSFFRAFHRWTGQTPEQVRATTSALA